MIDLGFIKNAFLRLTTSKVWKFTYFCTLAARIRDVVDRIWVSADLMSTGILFQSLGAEEERFVLFVLFLFIQHT